MPERVSKTIDDHFRDWEARVFGFGYGTGEDCILPALKEFFSHIGTDHNANAYNHETLEHAVTPTVAWLLINVLCHDDMIEYGTSPRFGWLTKKGVKLKEFIDGKSTEELCAIIDGNDERYTTCFPDACNCDRTYREGKNPCGNPFFEDQ